MSLLLVAAINFMASAQRHKEPKGTPAERAKEKTDKMAEHLALDEKQKDAVYTANLELIEDLDKKREEMKEAKLERKQMKDEIKVLMDEHDAELKTILNADQYAKFLKTKEHRKSRKMRRGREQAGEHPTEFPDKD